ncbi:GAP family protein [Ornithinimicrobium sp. Arc0846-15]|nr:GAP family protein [Ornithinimicrobium laminariae]
MGSVIGQILGEAIGTAISPVPIIAVILTLFSPAAGRNGVAFMLGWLFGTGAILFVSVAVGSAAESAGGSGGTGIVKILIGAAFLSFAWKQWAGRPRQGSAAKLPGWMESIAESSAARALGLGALISTVNPKNLGLALAAGSTIAVADLPGGQQIMVALVYTVLASLTIILPVLGYLIAPKGMEPVLTAIKKWLIANNALVMAVLFLALGAKTLAGGIALAVS